MDVEVRRNGPRPMRGAGRGTPGRLADWDWDLEIAAAISLVARDPHYRVVVTARARSGRALAGLDAAAADVGVVLERRIRPGGGWDVEVRAA